MARLLLLWLLCLFYFSIYAQSEYEDLNAHDQVLYNEHIYKGQPEEGKVYVRQGYVMKYNDKYRIPDWVTYHIVPDYLKTPKRVNKYASFRRDPDVVNPVVTGDYTHTGFARGHMVPYFAMGGDRDKNGRYSNLFREADDTYDDVTIFQGNYMSNITPQYQATLNGPGGPWYALETVIRTRLVQKLKSLHIIAGAIISDSLNYETLINRRGKTDIAVPDHFYQIIIYFDEESNEHKTAAFLFPHVDDKKKLPYDNRNLIQYIVPVDSIETLTGLDFFHELPAEEEQKIEKSDNRSFWEKWF